jgi:hypothetical protein
MASDIPHPEGFVHNLLQVIDIILLIEQNKNTLWGEIDISDDFCNVNTCHEKPA